MKTIEVQSDQRDLQQILDSAQHERVVISRAGKPSALVVGLEMYDAEELELAGSDSFWKMIEERRQRNGSTRLEDLRARFAAEG
jgi:prevent-host-death family protein